MAITETTQKELLEQLASMNKDLAEISQTVRQFASDYAQERKARMRGTAICAPERVKDSPPDVKDSLSGVEGEIQSKPPTSTQIAFAMGRVWKDP